MPYSGYAILSVSIRYYSDDLGAWYAVISEAIYAEKDVKNTVVYIAADESIKIEEGQYVVCGSFGFLPGKELLSFDVFSIAEEFAIGEEAVLPIAVRATCKTRTFTKRMGCKLGTEGLLP